MADLVPKTGQLGDTAAPTTIHTVTTGKTLDQADIVFFNTDVVNIEVTLYWGAKATANKIYQADIPLGPASNAVVPLVIKQQMAAGVTIVAEAESGKGAKINYFFTALEVAV